MIPTEALYPLLWAVEDAGARLFLGQGGEVRIDGRELVPADVLTKLRFHKPALAVYLQHVGRPQPADVPFVAKNLSVVVWPGEVVRGVSVFWLGDRPHWRLTPGVYVWLLTALEARSDDDQRHGRDLSWLTLAMRLMGEMGAWLDAHYPPHAVARAFKQRSPLTKPVKAIEVPDWSKAQPGHSWRTKYLQPSRS